MSWNQLRRRKKRALISVLQLLRPVQVLVQKHRRKLLGKLASPSPSPTNSCRSGRDSEKIWRHGGLANLASSGSATRHCFGPNRVRFCWRAGEDPNPGTLVHWASILTCFKTTCFIRPSALNKPSWKNAAAFITASLLRLIPQRTDAALVLVLFSYTFSHLLRQLLLDLDKQIHHNLLLCFFLFFFFFFINIFHEAAQTLLLRHNRIIPL